MPAKKQSPAAPKPATNDGLLVPEKIAPLVHYLRHEKVILDSDLAELYGVTTGRLNEAVKRNLDRFPADFMFQLTENEIEILRSQTVTSKNAEVALRSQFAILKRGQHRKYLPYAFTEQGVAMLSSVLRSPRAVQVNIAIMRTFVQLRRLMDSNALLAEKIEALEEKYAEHDQHFQIVFDAIKQLISADTDAKTQPKREIGFHSR
ncbi:MAG: ORF6N domain-containing protein [Verrucomicrobia bacterium]|nr:ORF6N domain-containing protein [Verrucomicrobiota bacterium]